jgi:catechol 2,3-dioxygenase-like lactoylglutathione lyase family enzyme
MNLNQITIEAQEFDACVAFYRLIGLRLIVLNGHYARFETPSGSTTLSIARIDRAATGGTVLYFEVEDVDRRHAELVALGVEFETPPKDESWCWRETHFHDPAGNRLCLYHAGPDRRFPPWRIED